MSVKYQAELARGRLVLVSGLLFAVLLAWALLHAYHTVREIDSHTAIPWVWLFAFTFLAIQMLLCFAERPYRATAAQMASLDLLSLVVNVPVYNEDPAALRECLRSLLTQTRKPALIHVVDDGSKVSYSETESWFHAEAARYGIMSAWDRQPNAGSIAHFIKSA